MLDESEVDHFHVTALVHEYVRRLDVAVDDALLVCFAECFRDRRDDLDRAVEGQSFVKQIAERLAFDILHHDERLPGRGLAVVVDHRDVWMAQRRNSPGLTNEARPVVMVSGSEKLDRDSPREMQVLGEINRAHAAFAKFFENSVMGDCLADHRGSRNLKLRPLCANEYSNSRKLIQGFTRCVQDSHEKSCKSCLSFLR